ncbi:MAG: DegT/DnrJ/EryC1/StrS family aminotransferase [Fimbriimonadia bacterium]|jgi:dTDP-4-amino-4,6-dideoxygalactose transaminase
MKVPLVDLNAQHAELRGRLDAALKEVLDSGRFILGPNVQALEQEIAERCGVQYGVGVASGTDALKIALQALGVGPGDEVITTPFTFVATVEVIAQIGAVPVFADIDPATFLLDPERVREKIGPRTKAILPVHLFGQLADMDALCEIAEERGLLVLEDGAQAIGATRNGKAMGAFGHAATLSFFPTKNLGAMGDGGMIVTNDERIYEHCIALRMHGMPAGDYMYREIGYASRLDEIQAAVLRVKHQMLDEWNRRRVRNAGIYFDLLEGTEVVLPSTLEGNTHTYHQFTIRHPRRDQLQAYLKEREVGCGIYYPAGLHLQEAYASYGHREGDFPLTEQSCREVLSLPVHAHLSEDQVRFAAESIAQFCKESVAAV